ncbi:hypothetical protein [Photobacterium kasasachensis]|uniref:hypothetical protein n=1 Tax=Photobacterium kasasachensis TaxID=2910240 RepID=UPI003D0E6E02
MNINEIAAYAKLLRKLVVIEKLPTDLQQHAICFHYFNMMGDELDQIVSNIDSGNSSKLLESRFLVVGNIFKNILRIFTKSISKFQTPLEIRVKTQLLEEFTDPSIAKDKIYETDLSNIEYYKSRLSFIELILYDIDVSLETSELIKEISFPPEYKQSGISILNYFSEVVESKYPDIDISVTIKQEGENVLMVITLPSGEEDIISRALHEYGKVVTGEMKATSFLSNQVAAISLEHKLEMAKMEVSHTKQLLAMERTNSESRICSLEQEVARLFSIIDSGLSEKSNEVKMLINLLDKEKQLTTDTIHTLIENLESAHSENNEDRAKDIVVSLKEESPSLYDKFNEIILKGAVAGASGNVFYSWLLAVIQSIPK